YEHVIRDSRASVLIVARELVPAVERVPLAAKRALRHLVVVGGTAPSGDGLPFEDAIASAAPDLEAEPTSRDSPALWLYSSGSTGKPKGCVHLHHDMVVCAELFGSGVLRISPRDRT